MGAERGSGPGLLSVVDITVEEDANTVVAEIPENARNQSEKPTEKLVEEAPDVAQPTSSDYYWNSYAHFGIHEEMLKDEVRTRSYRNAILNNAHAIKDKIVLDVGCGTGIMSLFAVQAGAKHVYAVDNSGIIEQAKQIAIDNDMQDKITFIRGKVEEITLPVDKVDIIISEWMGYFLFYESMLNTVIYARDKWLAADGYLLPDRASVSICGLEDGDYKEDKINWWNRVWGFDMSCIRKLAMLEPLIDTVNAQSVVTDHCTIMSVDLYTVKVEELDFKMPFRLRATRNDHLHAFVVYFDIWFTISSVPVHFSTGPHAQYTHWKQTVFYLDEVLYVSNGDEVRGTLASKPNSRNPRDLDIAIHYLFEGKFNGANRKQFFFLR